MKTLQKSFADQSEFLLASAEMVKNSGYLVTSPESVDSREMLKFQILVAQKPVAELEAEAVYVAPAGAEFQVGLEFKKNWQELLNKAHADFALTIEDEEKSTKYGKDANSLHHAISNMTHHEKIKVAMHGSREERRILLKDVHYSVHSYILKNPRLTTDEVAHIARMPNVTGEMIKSITQNVEWMANSAVRSGLVKNSKTPIPTVEKLMPKMGDNDLMQIAKSESVREAVAKQAIRVLASRGKKVTK